MTPQRTLRDRGRRALVTGAAGAIGSVVVERLQERGMMVVGADRRSGVDLLPCDVTDNNSTQEAVEAAVNQMGGLDVVVNVVGGSGRDLGDGPLHLCTDEAWDHVLDLNLRSLLHVVRAAYGHLGPGAAIVNVASVLGMVGGWAEIFDTHAYAAANGGVIALTRAMAATYADEQIRVCAVAPGLVDTPAATRARTNDRAREFVAGRQALTQGPVSADAVAATVAFLASVDAAGITGVVVPVDGGWTAR